MIIKLLKAHKKTLRQVLFIRPLRNIVILSLVSGALCLHCHGLHFLLEPVVDVGVDRLVNDFVVVQKLVKFYERFFDLRLFTFVVTQIFVQLAEYIDG